MIVKVLEEMCAGGLVLLLNPLKSAITGKGAEGSPQATAQSSYANFRVCTSFCSSSFTGIMTAEDKFK